MKIRFAVAAWVAGLALVPACSKTPPEPVDPMAPAFVEVQNQSFYEMTVYAIRSGMRVRLGQVGGNSTQTFEIPRNLVNPGVPIRFMADPVGSNRTPYSQEIAVHPGDTLKLRIPPS